MCFGHKLIPVLASLLLLHGRADSTGEQTKLSEAATLARQHQFREADQLLQGVKVPQNSSQAIAFYRLRAAIDAALNHPKQASEAMHAALRLAPENRAVQHAVALADLAWLDAQLKLAVRPELASTLSGLRSLTLTDPERAELRQRMAERLIAAHQVKQSLPDLLEVKKIHNESTVEAALGEVYEATGDSVASANSFQEAARLSPNEERYRLAWAIELMQHQTFEPALAVLKQAAFDFPKSARIRTAIGLTLYLSGEEEEGKQQLLEAHSLDAEFAPAIRYLGEIAIKERAIPDARIVKAECDYANAHPSDSESGANCGALEAHTMTSSSDASGWPPILRRLAAVSDLSPKSGLAHCEYGKALYDVHDWERARTELQICVLLEPDSIEGHYRLARVYERFGQKDLARTQLLQHAAAVRRMAATNEAREQSVKRFLYTMSAP